jgi:multicomponent Na+:H+ antiporter subunit D
VRLMSPSMLGGASALVAAGVALTVFAGPLFQLADNAAENLVRPERYVEAVLDPASAPRPVVEEAP